MLVDNDGLDIVPGEDLSEIEALTKLTLAVDGNSTDNDYCCAISSLKNLGWTIDRQLISGGFRLTFYKPIEADDSETITIDVDE